MLLARPYHGQFAVTDRWLPAAGAATSSRSAATANVSSRSGSGKARASHCAPQNRAFPDPPLVGCHHRGLGRHVRLGECKAPPGMNRGAYAQSDRLIVNTSVPGKAEFPKPGSNTTFWRIKAAGIQSEHYHVRGIRPGGPPSDAVPTQGRRVGFDRLGKNVVVDKSRELGVFVVNPGRPVRESYLPELSQRHRSLRWSGGSDLRGHGLWIRSYRPE